MLHFNELRLTPDNRFLIIDASVDPQSYFDGILIDSIVIDNQDTYVTNGPSSNPVYSYKVSNSLDLTYSLPENCNCNPVLEDEDKSYCFTYGTETSGRNVRLVINLLEEGITACGNIFFVYVVATGTVAPGTPCGFGTNPLIGTLINFYPIYKATLKYLKELNNECEIPCDFIDMILKLKGIELCVRTGNYPQAIKFWNKFFKKLTCTPPSAPKCGCYG